MSAAATLCPRGTASRVVPPSGRTAPDARSSRASRTLSAEARRRTEAVEVIWSILCLQRANGFERHRCATRQRVAQRPAETLRSHFEFITRFGLKPVGDA